MARRPKAELLLSQAETEQLKLWALRRETAHAMAMLSRIVLACASGALNNGPLPRAMVIGQTHRRHPPLDRVILSPDLRLTTLALLRHGTNNLFGLEKHPVRASQRLAR
jgi:hypothetical protein